MSGRFQGSNVMPPIYLYLPYTADTLSMTSTVGILTLNTNKIYSARQVPQPLFYCVLQRWGACRRWWQLLRLPACGSLCSIPDLPGISPNRGFIASTDHGVR